MSERCGTCGRRTCPRNGTCESRRRRRARYGSLCEGEGHPGGAAYQKVCIACKLPKANTAYWGGADTCRACTTAALKGTRYERKRETRRVEPRHVRLSFAEHMIRCHASDADRALVDQALARYGKSGPCADDVIEEYVATHPTTATAGDIRHAVVLLANELGVESNSSRSHRQRAA